VLFDAKPGAAEAARVRLGETWAKLVERGKLPVQTASAARERLVTAGSLGDLAACELVMEAIVEDLDVKRRVFRELEGVVGPDCVLASNTSSLSVTAIASACEAPGRVAGYHFFNPVPLMRVVEVVAGARTEPRICDRLAAFAGEMGHRAVRCGDSPGFIVNHAGRGFGTEALQIVAAEGAAGFADVDRALRDQVGFRLGPFELMDLTGLDVSQPVMESMHRQFHGEPRFRPSWLLRQRLDAGLLGRKAGEGFYRHGPGGQEPVPSGAVPSAEPCPCLDRDRRAGLASGSRRRRAGRGLERGRGTESPRTRSASWRRSAMTPARPRASSASRRTASWRSTGCSDSASAGSSWERPRRRRRPSMQPMRCSARTAPL
jgi:3-hydroxybutyryl-CoA dehydrogenase